MGVLDGRAVVVTGGAGLLRSEFCTALAAEGARVLMNDVNAEAANAPAAQTKQLGGEAAAFVESVDPWEKAGRLIGACVERYGRIDTLVTCAHCTLTHPIWELWQEELDATLAVHRRGHFKPGGCSLVNIERLFQETVGAVPEMPGMGVPHYRW